MPARTHVALTTEPLSVDDAHQWCADPRAGAVVVFSGTVRDHAEGRAVDGLCYEAYEELAKARLDALAESLASREGVVAVWLTHRTGALGIGEVAVVAAVGAGHRPEAFATCRDAIDRLKAEVPIWKQEHWADGGSHWPGAT